MTDAHPTPGTPDEAPGATSLAEAAPQAATPAERAAPEEHELLCTLCGLRACWTG